MAAVGGEEATSRHESDFSAPAVAFLPAFVAPPALTSPATLTDPLGRHRRGLALTFGYMLGCPSPAESSSPFLEPARPQPNIPLTLERRFYA